MFVVFWNDHNPTSCFWDMDVRKATRRNPFFSIPFFFLNKEQKVYFLFCNGIYIPTNKNQIVDTLEIPSLQFAGFKMFQSLVIFFSQVGSTGSCALWWVLPLHCHKVEGHATTLGCLGVAGGVGWWQGWHRKAGGVKYRIFCRHLGSVNYHTRNPQELKMGDMAAVFRNTEATVGFR